MKLHKALKEFKPAKEFFIGIDSDGCVFDSMEVKQKEFFIPLALKQFNLWPVAGILRKTWEFVNLYSAYRGSNRFISLIRVFEMLTEDEKVKNSGVKLPGTAELKQWVQSENKLSNDTLRAYCENINNKDLDKILQWSEAVNNEIGLWLRNLPPFANVRKALEIASGEADLVVVSQTPADAIIREWKEHDLEKYVRAIAGQEDGTKSEHIRMATAGRYSNDRILMVGDAIGDLKAAEANAIHFFPIIPGDEDESWAKFIIEAYPRFIEGRYNQDYEQLLIADFRKSLPEKPGW
ncbi:MAG TPA: HAD hydrolase-like protein [Bacteroidales bacterium]|nr:HAD hydrolase-like protein [Bacteroidales bacterium]